MELCVGARRGVKDTLVAGPVRARQHWQHEQRGTAVPCVRGARDTGQGHRVPGADSAVCVRGDEQAARTRPGPRSSWQLCSL